MAIYGNYKFNLSLLSQYRTPLMGLAALLIIACHAPASGVFMAHWAHVALAHGNIGVDIFLFLSGIGCWFSLSKGSQTNWGGAFLKKRFFSSLYTVFAHFNESLCSSYFLTICQKR